MREIYIKNNTLYINSDLFNFCKNVKIVYRDSVLKILDMDNIQFDINIKKVEVLKVYVYINNDWYYYGYLLNNDTLNSVTSHKIESILRKRYRLIKEITNND